MRSDFMLHIDWIYFYQRGRFAYLYFICTVDMSWSRFMLTRQQVLYGLERVELRSTSLFDDCPLRNREARQDECSGFAALFRTPDGTCNNFHHPTWGASFTPFLRFLPPDYRFEKTTSRFILTLKKLSNLRLKEFSRNFLCSISLHTDGNYLHRKKTSGEW